MSGGAYFGVIDAARDVPLLEVVFGDAQPERAFVVHAALDTLDAARLGRPTRLFPGLERTPTCVVHGYVAPGGHRLLLAAGTGLRPWGEDALAAFMADASEVLVRCVLLSPFTPPFSALEPAIRVLAQKHLSLA